MRFYYILLVALFVDSCSNSRMIQKSLNTYDAPIGYLYDSKISDCPKIDHMSVRLYNNVLDSITEVSKINGFVLPLIVFNYFETNMRVRLGQSSIQQQYNDFFTRSFLEESKRTGCFEINNQVSNDTLYSLDITIDTCNTDSKYKRSTFMVFFFLGAIKSSSEMGFSSETNLYVSTKLKKANSIISEKSYKISRIQPFQSPKRISADELQGNFTVNMVESLSLGTKQCIETIINDLNSTIKKN
jgi:hypothetical protein